MPQIQKQGFKYTPKDYQSERMSAILPISDENSIDYEGKT